MLTSAWDQNTFNYVMSPAGSVPKRPSRAGCSTCSDSRRLHLVGLVTGATMANFTARRRPPPRAGRGRLGRQADGRTALEVHVVVGADRHASLDLARCAISAWARRVRRSADDQGRMRADALPAVLAGCDGPTIVCAQAGNVGSGAVDPMAAICAAAHQRPDSRRRGCTSTGRSDSGPRPARRCGTCAPVWTEPIPGRWTRTSG
jgi:hypothetical protein